MKPIVLTCQSELESAQKLGFKTQFQLEGDVEDYYNSIIIRWGNRRLHYDKYGNKTDFLNVITKQKAIELNCNKPESLKKLSEVVLTPKIYCKDLPKQKFCVIRSNQHTGGQNFKVEKNVEKLPFNSYATEFIKSDREIRVWYFNGSMICARRVTKNEGELNKKFKCRSLWSYKFWKKTPKNIKKQVRTAARHLGFVYGAFDILEKNGKWYFLENNSSPSLDHDKIVKFYKNKMKNFVKKQIKEAKIRLKKNPPFEYEYKVKDYSTLLSKKIEINDNYIIPFIDVIKNALKPIIPVFAKPLYFIGNNIQNAPVDNPQNNA